MRTLLLAAVAAALLAPCAPARAQGVLTGLIVDDATEAPVQGARVTLRAEGGRRVRDVVTDADGRFRFTPSPGYYRFDVRRLGYTQISTPHVRVIRDSVELEIRMRVEGVMLAPVTVVARAGRTSPVLQGFYERMENGFGRYFSRDQIERRSPGQITDLLRMVPGVRFHTRGSGVGLDISFGRALMRPGGCPVQIFLDGMRVNRPAPPMAGRDTLIDLTTSPLDEGLSIDALAHPSELEGIEIYPGMAGVPAQFMGPDARCGTVAIWTRER